MLDLPNALINSDWYLPNFSIISNIEHSKINNVLDNLYDVFICGYKVKDNVYIPSFNNSHLIDGYFPVIMHNRVLEDFGHIFDTIFSFAHFSLWSFLSIAKDLRIKLINEPLIEIDFTKEIDKNPIHTSHVYKCMSNGAASIIQNISIFKDNTNLNVVGSNSVSDKCLNFLNITKDLGADRTVEIPENGIIINPEFKYNFDNSFIKLIDHQTFTTLTQCNNLQFFDIIRKIA